MVTVSSRLAFSSRQTLQLTHLQANHSYIYPQRVGTAKYTAHRNMRMRYLLDHPEHMKGQRELMRALTERPDYGVEFVERLVVIRVCIPAFGSAVIALLIAIVYGAVKGDWPGGFGIACASFAFIPKICCVLTVLRLLQRSSPRRLRCLSAS